MVSLGPLEGTTPNYGFNLVNFDWVAWSEYEHENWTVVDALLAAFIGINNVSGQWANNTAYIAGKRVVDSTDGTIWEVLIAHTSAAAGTFAADRVANPTFWQTISPYTPIYKGVWANNTLYTKSDFVSDPNRYFIAKATHTSPAAGTIDGDIANWDTLIDLTSWANNLVTTDANVATNVTNIATNVTNIATNATNIATNVGDIATNAADIVTLQGASALNIISKAVDYVILPADLTDYAALIVLVDASAANRTITLPTPANYANKQIQVIADVDPAGFSVITNKSGGTEWHTGYAKGDFVKVSNDGTVESILDEYVTVKGEIYKTAGEFMNTAISTNPFDTDASKDVDVGGWFDFVTNYRLDPAFKCRLIVEYLTLGRDIAGKPNISGVYPIVAANPDYAIAASATFEFDLLSTDYFRPDVFNTSTGARTMIGNAGKTESYVKWRVVKRLR